MATYDIEITDAEVWKVTVDADDMAEAQRRACDILAAIARGDGRYEDGVERSASMTTTVSEV